MKEKYFTEWKSITKLLPSQLFLNVFFFVFIFIAEALRLHGSRLTDYERQEIDKYPEIWFLGLDACKINAKPGTALNSGYDDDNGSYNKVSETQNILFENHNIRALYH